MNTLESEPMGMVDRLKAAGSVVMTGKLPNPLASEPADKSRAALVKELNDWALREQLFWRPTFERIREDMSFGAGNQWGDARSSDAGQDCYQADIVQRHLQQKEASLFCKNPTWVAKRRPRMEYTVWDGEEDSLRGAYELVAANAQALQQIEQIKKSIVPSPESGVGGNPDAEQQLMALQASLPGALTGALAIVSDFENARKQRRLETTMGVTLTRLFDQQLDEQSPAFQLSMKQLVTRVNTCGVGWAKIMFRRSMTGGETPKDPNTQAPNAEGEQPAATGTAAQLAAIKQRMAALNEPGVEMDSAMAGELELMLRQLRADAPEGQSEISDEGLVIQFLGATAVIVDRNCTNLRGLVGCNRMAHEVLMDVEACEREYGVSLRDTGAKVYGADGTSDADMRTEAGGKNDDSQAGPGKKVCVLHIYDKVAGLCYTVCDGVKDFLREPYAPKPDWSFFWNILPLTFRPIEVERNEPEKGVTCYPRSDVRLLMPMQREKNRSREAYREHRKQNRPGWVYREGAFNEADKAKLADWPAFGAIGLQGLAPGDDISKIFARKPTEEVNPMNYDTGAFDADALQVVGTQPANLGQQGVNEKATGQAIAEGSRIQAVDSNVSDMEEFMSLMAEGAGLLLMEMKPTTVKRKVGQGAVWPEVSMADMRENLWLEIEAGSTGRPNQALELRNFADIGPQLKEMMMAEGVSLRPLIKEGVRRLDDGLEVDDFTEPRPVQPGQVQSPESQVPSPGGQPGMPAAPGGMQPGAPRLPNNTAGLAKAAAQGA